MISSSLQYLPGICLVFAAIYEQAILPDHVQSYVSQGHRTPSQRNAPFASYAGLISFAAFLFLFERIFAVNVVSLSMPAKSLSKITDNEIIK